MKNKLSLNIILIISSPLLLISCGHHHDVRAGADGVHRVVVREQSKEAAEQSAIDQANHYCGEKDKEAAVVEEKETKYTGTMDEKTRDTLNKASKAAMVLGGAMNTNASHDNGKTDVSVGKRGSSKSGQTVGAAGAAGAVMTGGNDYVAEMTFKCI